MPNKVLIASNNRYKADEIQKLLGIDYLCLSLCDFPDAPPVVEDSNTFAGNAVKKALSLVNWLKINNEKIATTNDGITVNNEKTEIYFKFV